MKVHFTLEEYLHQLKLMQEQYGQEEELYPWVYMMLQMAECEKRKYGIDEKLSFRQVENPKRDVNDFPGRKLIYGYASFPDIAILDCSFYVKEDKKEAYDWCNNINHLYGCVEQKKPFENGEISNLLVLLNGQFNVNLQNAKTKYKDNKQCGEGTFSLNEEKLQFKDYIQLIAELLWYGKMLYTNGLAWKYLEVKECTCKKTEIENVKSLRHYLFKTFIYGKKAQCAGWAEAIAELQEKNDLKITISCQEIGNLEAAYHAYGKKDLGIKHLNEWKKLVNNLSSIIWKEEPSQDNNSNQAK